MIALYDSDQTDEGTAFVFLGGTSGIADADPTTGAARFESDQADAEFGWSVAGAGDVDGDGYDDLIVGAPRYESGQTDQGAAFLYLGGRISALPAVTAPVRVLLVCLLVGIALLGQHFPPKHRLLQSSPIR